MHKGRSVKLECCATSHLVGCNENIALVGGSGIGTVCAYILRDGKIIYQSEPCRRMLYKALANFEEWNDDYFTTMYGQPILDPEKIIYGDCDDENENTILLAKSRTGKALWSCTVPGVHGMELLNAGECFYMLYHRGEFKGNRITHFHGIAQLTKDGQLCWRTDLEGREIRGIGPVWDDGSVILGTQDHEQRFISQVLPNGKMIDLYTLEPYVRVHFLISEARELYVLCEKGVDEKSFYLLKISNTSPVCKTPIRIPQITWSHSWGLLHSGTHLILQSSYDRRGDAVTDACIHLVPTDGSDHIITHKISVDPELSAGTCQPQEFGNGKIGCAWSEYRKPMPSKPCLAILSDGEFSMSRIKRDVFTVEVIGKRLYTQVKGTKYTWIDCYGE